MNVFADDDFYTGPPIDDAAVRAAEEHLGVTLPAAYVDLLRERNGGVPINGCLPTPFATSWADDHFEIRGILGVGGEWGIDSPVQGSRSMIEEWGYPGVGVVLADTPSGGHDTVMLDYSECGPRGEPAVIYVDEDREPRRIADTFAEFLAGLVDCSDLG